jgi:hypothetical protein
MLWISQAANRLQIARTQLIAIAKYVFELESLAYLLSIYGIHSNLSPNSTILHYLPTINTRARHTQIHHTEVHHKAAAHTVLAAAVHTLVVAGPEAAPHHLDTVAQQVYKDTAGVNSHTEARQIAAQGILGYVSESVNCATCRVQVYHHVRWEAPRAREHIFRPRDR